MRVDINCVERLTFNDEVSSYKEPVLRVIDVLCCLLREIVLMLRAALKG